MLLTLAEKQQKQFLDNRSANPFEHEPKDYPDIIKLLKAAGAK